ncbi:MAG: hypothetical protein ABI835_17690 [Chloroflexota bacterium]
MLTILVSIAGGLIAAWYYWRHEVPLVHWLGVTLDGKGFPPRDFVAGTAIGAISVILFAFVELVLGTIRIREDITFNITFLANAAFLNLIIVLILEFLERSLLLSGVFVILAKRKWLALMIYLFILTGFRLPDAPLTLLSVIESTIVALITGIAFLDTGRIWLGLGTTYAWLYLKIVIYGTTTQGAEFGGLVVQQVTDATLLTGSTDGADNGLIGLALRLFIFALTLMWLYRAKRQGDISNSTI